PAARRRSRHRLRQRYQCHPCGGAIPAHWRRRSRDRGQTFPKVTSLAADARQELLRIAEFQGKIAAAVATRRDPDFLIIARTEALIAGLGEAEAHKRAAAYAEAGADMILVHSKQKTPDEIERFVKAWTGPLPLAIVPTAIRSSTKRVFARSAR